MQQGDAAWAARAEGHDGQGAAAPEPVGRAVHAYHAATIAAPQRVDAHWKLLRAMYFEAQYASGEGEAQSAGFERAVQTTQASFIVLEESTARASNNDLARLHFWSALIWGAWGQERNLLTAVRKGVANQLRRHGEAAIALDPNVERGGGHRLMSRLHASVPRVPFLTGWVDRDRIFPEMLLAYEVAPDFPGNHLLMAVTLLELAPERREEARALLQRVARLEPDPDDLVEQLAMREEGREKLADLAGGSIEAAP